MKPRKGESNTRTVCRYSNVCDYWCRYETVKDCKIWRVAMKGEQHVSSAYMTNPLEEDE